MLSWMASCCQGNPKNGPMGEVAGVTNCRPAMLQRVEGRLDFSEGSLILFHYPQLSLRPLSGQKKVLPRD